ncbi:MAG TPA: 50S ribosomal protein L11 methyltransferase [Xanthobacteraceae bacterium]|nr:50S ribosomal protein L11 methyltransferase [Xanthobacteraceae bacterium]
MHFEPTASLPPTTVASVDLPAPQAQRLATLLAGEIDDAGVAAFEAGGTWRVEIHAAALDEVKLRDLVSDLAGPAVGRALAFATIEPRDWVAASLAGLKPVEAGRFLVHGAHDRARAARARVPVEIEAALAFGTGHHGTTRGCLLALDHLLRARRPRRILDVGTGTGVLAIAAAKAMHAPVVASDIDRIAVLVARDNARLNHAGGTITFVHAAGLSARALRAKAPYDLVLANILLPPLQRLAAPMARLLAPHARVVLSGLLPEHVNAARAAYAAQGLALERRMIMDGWATLVFRRGA